MSVAWGHSSDMMHGNGIKKSIVKGLLGLLVDDAAPIASQTNESVMLQQIQSMINVINTDNKKWHHDHQTVSSRNQAFLVSVVLASKTNALFLVV